MAEEEKPVEAAPTETLTNVDDIVIPEADLKKLDDELAGGKEKETSPEAETVVPESDDKKDEKEEKDETDEDQELEEEPTFAINAEGKEKFTAEQIKKWREDSANSEAFIKSATDRTKEASESRKSLEPVIGLIKILKDAGEKNAEIKEYLVEELGIDKGALDAAFAFKEGKFDDPLKEELATEKDAREKSEKELVLIKDKHDFCKRHNVKMSTADKVYDFALKMNEESGQLFTLDTAYREMAHPKAEEELKELKDKIKKLESGPKVEITKLPDKNKGAADIKAKKAETFDDASFDEALRKDPNFQKLEEEIGK